MKRIFFTISFFTTFSLSAQISEKYMATSPCYIFPTKYERLADSLLKKPVMNEEIMFIQGYFRDEFLKFRLIQTPDMPDEVRYEPQGYQQYRYPVEALLPDSIAKNDPLQIVKISRWPEHKPLPNFFLIEKNGNHFFRGKYKYEDTITVTNLFDSLYYFDRYFLVYYRNWGNEKYCISGNLSYNQSPMEEWDKYLCSMDWIIYAKLVMYGVKEWPVVCGSNTNGMRYYTAKATEIGHNNVLVETGFKFTKFNYNVIFFTNDKKYTLDDDIENIYEISFRTKELNIGKETHMFRLRQFEDLQPKRKFIFSMKEHHGRYLTYYISSYIRDTYNISISFSDLNGINFFNGNESYFIERDKKEVVGNEEIVEEAVEEIEPIIKNK
jgi:hypothetical protein